MTGNRQVARAVLLLTCGLAFAGCGRHGSASQNGPLFDSAAPEIKADWTTAVAADQSNDFVTAACAYKKILSQSDGLPAAQITAAKTAFGLLNQRMVNASIAGDPAARQALITLHAMDSGQAAPP